MKLNFLPLQPSFHLKSIYLYTRVLLYDVWCNWIVGSLLCKLYTNCIHWFCDLLLSCTFFWWNQVDDRYNWLTSYNMLFISASSIRIQYPSTKVICFRLFIRLPCQWMRRIWTWTRPVLAMLVVSGLFWWSYCDVPVMMLLYVQPDGRVLARSLEVSLQKTLLILLLRWRIFCWNNK